MQVINTLKSRLLRKNYAIQAIAYSVKNQTGVVHAKLSTNLSIKIGGDHVVWFFDQDGETYSGAYCNESYATKTFLLRINDQF